MLSVKKILKLLATVSLYILFVSFGDLLLENPKQNIASSFYAICYVLQKHGCISGYDVCYVVMPSILKALGKHSYAVTFEILFIFATRLVR